MNVETLQKVILARFSKVRPGLRLVEHTHEGELYDWIDYDFGTILKDPVRLHEFKCQIFLLKDEGFQELFPCFCYLASLEEYPDFLLELARLAEYKKPEGGPLVVSGAAYMLLVHTVNRYFTNLVPECEDVMLGTNLTVERKLLEFIGSLVPDIKIT